MYIISIIMPTFNSERTIEQSLLSVRNQKFNQDMVEILVIDGGSTDSTIEIAKRYGAKIINNSKRLPEYAKRIGFEIAQGKYGIYLDSDESFVSMDSFQRRCNFFEENPEVKNITSTGLLPCIDEAKINAYANAIGDPFSNFVYGFYDGFNRIPDLKKQYKYHEKIEGVLFDYSYKSVFPLFDAWGNMFDIEFAKKIQNDNDISDISTDIFSIMVNETRCSAVLYDDYVVHRSGLTSKRYISKIKWRIINNLYGKDAVGFSEREKRQIGLKLRKMLFVPYCLLVFPVIIHSIFLCLKYKDFYYFMDFLYTEITFIMIVLYVIRKSIGIDFNVKSTYS